MGSIGLSLNVLIEKFMFLIIPVSITIVIISYGLGYLTVFHKKQLPLSVTMAYASGIRNISLGIVLTMSYFSPQTAIPVLIAVLLQKPIAILYSFALQKLNKHTCSQTTRSTVR